MPHEEKWLDIEGWGNYQVSDLGRVRNVKLGRMKSPVETKGGYLQVTIFRSAEKNRSKSRSILVHTLVIETFIGKKPYGHSVRHIDGNIKNNSLDNLEYVPNRKISKAPKEEKECATCKISFMPTSARQIYCTLACNKNRPNPKTCINENCDRITITGKECTTCAGMRRRRAKGIMAPKAKQGRAYTRDGYVRVYYPEHPNSDSTGYVFEHRYVMAQKLGRPLYRFENVHHKNGIKTDNSLENLELWTKPQAVGQRVEDLVLFVLTNYKDFVIEKINSEKEG